MPRKHSQCTQMQNERKYIHIHLCVCKYLQGPWRKQKTQRIVVLRRGSPRFHLGKTLDILSVCDSHKLLLATQPGIQILTHEWTETSLFLFLQGYPLRLLPFTHTDILFGWHQGSQNDMWGEPWALAVGCVRPEVRYWFKRVRISHTTV